jgi:acetyl/propionyl-CoA carboxylase alpha subunit
VEILNPAGDSQILTDTAMNYTAKCDEREIAVAVEALGGSTYKVTINGINYAVDALQVTSNLWSILLDNKSIEVDITRLPGDDFEVLIDGDCHKFTLLNEQRRQMIQSGEKELAAKSIVTSPMPGKVVRLLVEAGEEVRTNQGLIVIEAMKMENELRSTGMGKVKEVFVKEGDVVESGARLLLLE